jgi:hypothetical protein
MKVALFYGRLIFAQFDGSSFFLFDGNTIASAAGISSTYQ